MLASDQPVIYDTVTLHHFAAANRLDILVSLHGHRPEPRWSDEVEDEVRNGLGHPDSASRSRLLLSQTWLGQSSQPSNQKLVFKIQAALATPENQRNLGESESMALAIETGAIFVTDDAAAYDFALHMPEFGHGRVLDTCQLLSIAEGNAEISSSDVARLHEEMANDGRTLRCRCIYWRPASDPS